MASVKLYLDTRVPKKDGTFPLKIAVTHKGKFLINLKIYLKEDEFESNKVILHKDKKAYNQIIEQWLLKIKLILLDLDANGKLKKITQKQLKALIENYSETNEEVSETPYLFKTHFDKFIAGKSNKRTKEIYLATLNKMSKYSNIDSLSFEDINLAWLKEFQSNLIDEKLSINAQAIHFRNIRAIFNDAIDEEAITQNTYPFRKFKIKKEATLKRSLTVEELIQLRDYPCEPYLEKYRDLFMLIFYLIGINIVDLLHLKGLSNGKVIEYRRAKTGRIYSISVLPEAKIIIEKYKGDNYLLDILDNYKDYKDFSGRMNKNLKRISLT